MVFNSPTFIVFFAAFIAIYVFLKGRARLWFLLISSYFFYGWWDWRFLFIIFLTTAVDYYAGIKIMDSAAAQQRRAFLTISVGLNLTVLFVFKYFNFFISSFEAISHSIGLNPPHWALKVVLPVGISFYTFQSIAYTVDVYRRRIPCERDFFSFAAFVAFFPQLVAGPIERAQRLLPQIKKLPQANADQIRAGCGLIVWGYFLKVFIADNMAAIVDVYFSVGRKILEHLAINPPDPFILNNPDFYPLIARMGLHLTSVEIMMIMLAFALQIYGDFAGYSNIARGIAKLLGIEVIANFRQPYLARNPSDFWQRWHISLSSWFRDYVYIPLGGNRLGGLTTVRNLVLTMLIAGLWHGAAWTFVCWGAYHAVLLAFYHVMRNRAPLKESRNAASRFLSTIVMFIFTLYGWLIFRSNGFAQLKYFTQQLLTNWQWPAPQVLEDFQVKLFWVLLFAGVIFIADIILEWRQKECILTFRRVWEYPLALFLLWLTIVFGARSETFIYFRF